MKLFILLSAFLSFNAFALEPKEPLAVCDRIPTQAQTTECLVAIRGAYIDHYAAAACDRITTGAATVSCMRTIANKTYNRAEVEVCDRYSSNQGTIECLAAVGTPVDENQGGGRYRRFVQETAQEGLQALDRGDTERARRALFRLAR